MDENENKETNINLSQMRHLDGQTNSHIKSELIIWMDHTNGSGGWR